MGTILDIRDANLFDGFNFEKMHEGICIANNMFETKGIIYVTIPELFIGTDDSSGRSYQTHIDNSKVMTDNPNLKYRTEINRVNYIECSPIVFNGFSIGSLKPEVGNYVMVFFLNGDTKLPYYLNAHPLKVDEEIMNSSNEGFSDYTDWGYYRIIKLKKEPMFGADVHKVGTKLANIGLDIHPKEDDGIFYYDEKMFEAVKLFQQRIGITKDGEVGPITWRMLMRFKGKIGQLIE